MIARIEKDTKKPGRETAKKLAKAFNRTIEYILDGKNPGLVTQTEDETALVERYRKSSAHRRGAVLVLLGDDEDATEPVGQPPPPTPPRHKN